MSKLYERYIESTLIGLVVEAVRCLATVTGNSEGSLRITFLREE
jgi:hypothetical protein